MASLPTPNPTPSAAQPPKISAADHRLQDAKVVPVPRPPVASSADW